jgi:hypothetical protein
MTKGSIVNLITLHHAISAAAVAGTLVSETLGSRELLARVPMQGLGLASLPDLLKRLKRARTGSSLTKFGIRDAPESRGL